MTCWATHAAIWQCMSLLISMQLPDKSMAYCQMWQNASNAEQSQVWSHQGIALSLCRVIACTNYRYELHASLPRIVKHAILLDGINGGIGSSTAYDAATICASLQPESCVAQKIHAVQQQAQGIPALPTAALYRLSLTMLMHLHAKRKINFRHTASHQMHIPHSQQRPFVKEAGLQCALTIGMPSAMPLSCTNEACFAGQVMSSQLSHSVVLTKDPVGRPWYISGLAAMPAKGNPLAMPLANSMMSGAAPLKCSCAHHLPVLPTPDCT